MSDTAEATRRDLTVTGPDPYARAGARASAQGLYMSFTKLGNYVAGEDKRKIPTGTRMIANMPGLRYGWRGWFGGPPEDLTQLVSEGYQPPRRAEMGDTDESLWAKNTDGSPKDPWQLTYILELADPRDGQIYIFAPSSFGGRRAVEKLCGAYAEGRRMNPGMAPIVALNSGTFTSKKYGETANPVLDIVGWTDENEPSLTDAGEPDEPLPYDDTPPFDPPAKPAAQPQQARRATRF